MPRMTVHMFGIMFFDLCEMKSKATVYLPDGRDGDGPMIPPHHASLFVEADVCESYEGWTPIRHEVANLTGRAKHHRVGVLEFRLANPCRLVFPEDHRVKPVDTSLVGKALLPMPDIDPQFKPNPSGEGSIAIVEITTGTLEAFTFNRNANAVQWTIRTGEADPTISVGPMSRSTEGRSTASLTLKEDCDSEFGAEVILANAPDFLSGYRPADDLHRRMREDHSDHDHHFGLFRKIDASKSKAPLPFPRHRTNIHYRSNAMAAYDQVFEIAGSCTPPCCPR